MDPEPTPRRSPIAPGVAHTLGEPDYGRLETMPLERLKALCDELYYSMDDLELERRIEKLFVNYEIFSELPDKRAPFMFLAKKHANSKPSDFLEFYVRGWFIKTDTNGEYIYDANGYLMEDEEKYERWKEENERNFFILLYTALTAPAIIEARTPKEIEDKFKYYLSKRERTIADRFKADHSNNREEWLRVNRELHRGSVNFANDYLRHVRQAAIANNGTLDNVIIEGKRQHEQVLNDIIEIAENRIRAANPPAPRLLSLFRGPGGKKRGSTRRRKQKSRRSKKAHRKYQYNI